MNTRTFSDFGRAVGFWLTEHARVWQLAVILVLLLTVMLLNAGVAYASPDGGGCPTPC